MQRHLHSGVKLLLLKRDLSKLGGENFSFAHVHVYDFLRSGHQYGFQVVLLRFLVGTPRPLYGRSCHRSFSLLREPIEFRLEHKAVCFERNLVAFACHEHRLSIEKQTP